MFEYKCHTPLARVDTSSKLRSQVSASITVQTMPPHTASLLQLSWARRRSVPVYYSILPLPSVNVLCFYRGRRRKADLSVHDVHVHEGGTRLPVPQDRELLPPRTGLLAAGHSQGPRLQGQQQCYNALQTRCKKRLLISPASPGPAVMSLIKLSLAGNN